MEPQVLFPDNRINTDDQNSYTFLSFLFIDVSWYGRLEDLAGFMVQ